MSAIITYCMRIGRVADIYTSQMIVITLSTVLYLWDIILSRALTNLDQVYDMWW